MRGKGVHREVYYRQPSSSIASAGSSFAAHLGPFAGHRVSGDIPWARFSNRFHAFRKGPVEAFPELADTKSEPLTPHF
jgi:hypothetical protein